MKKLLFFVTLATCMTLQAKVIKVASPNGRITVSISDSGGALSYSAALQNIIHAAHPSGKARDKDPR